MALIPRTDLDVFPLNLGGNVFGWTADREQSFAVLDAFLEAGGNFIDTADVYSAWADGNSGGESETVLGEWFESRGNRDRVILATKVGQLPDHRGLGKANIHAAVEDSLRRLRTDYIDLYYAHRDDEGSPQEETLSAFDELVRAGKVRYIAASNFTPERLNSALDISERDGLARYVALQPHYNLVERAEYESGLADIATERELAVFPYYALAAGFLTGKHRKSGTSGSQRRVDTASKYDDERGNRVLDALDEVAAEHGCTPTAIALAWLRAQPSITAPIASARNLEQLPELLRSTRITLTETQLDQLTKASG
ncbi:aldo/keto reductase [Sciscionella sediminilitoris]|uniref:aldo/keto reductase n=1 Tax=Sciscionella sediminilitoris TaxID=1445613 RepID=UPI0004DFC53A|nr:aldo/keto reductase [Sciscionella sp. SE31]